MRHIKLFPCSLMWIASSILFVAPVLASNLDEGIRFYNGGKYADSINYFEKEIAAHPGSVAAHYYLANCLAELRRNKEAAAEYQRALKLDPQGPAAKFCSKALTNLAAASSSQTAPSSDTDRESTQKNENAIGHIQSSSDVSDSTTGQETEFEKEANQRVARINKEAAEKVRALEVERDRQLEPYHYGKYGLVKLASSITDPIKADYQKQIDSIQLCAKKEADAVLIYAKQRSIALEDAAIDLNKAYSKTENSSVRLVPNGTNLYMRNYKTESAPSGNPVGLMAPPTKALKQINQSYATKDKN